MTDRNPLHSATREFGHSRQLSQSHFVEGMRRIRFKDIVKMAENETLKVNVESGEEYEYGQCLGIEDATKEYKCPFDLQFKPRWILNKVTDNLPKLLNGSLACITFFGCT